MVQHSLHQTTLGAKPPVTVKGTKHGLLFMLDEHCPFNDLNDGVRDLLEGRQSQLFKGADIGVYVDYGSRELSSEENRALLKLFLNQENFTLREWSPRTTERKSLFRNSEGNLPSHALYRGTVRSGQQLQFEGDVVVLGDINPGGHISATGDIYVFGRLAGIAHAGSDGAKWCVIAAVDFAPMQLRIANFVGYAPEDGGKILTSQLEFAYLKDDKMAVDKLQFLASFWQYRSELSQHA